MEKKAIGIWIRVSTEDQAKGESPQHHERRARLYAEAKGWDVKMVYHLEAVSGKAVMQHPEAQKMLKHIKDGTITGLIFSKLARLARNTRELLDFADYFREHDADLISLQESIDTSTPAGRLFYTMIAAMAQWEREEISSRVAASVPIRAKMGKPLGGYAPYGYRWENGQVVIEPKEAPIRRLAYELFMKYKRIKTTVSALNQQGYRGRAGALFSDPVVERMLRCPSAKGLRRANYCKTENNRTVLKPESEWVYFPCPAIVDVNLWQACNSILDEKGKKRKKPGPRAVHLLSGYVKCSCGKTMYIYHAKSASYRCQGCKISIPESDLNEIFFEQLKTFLLTDTDIKSYAEKAGTEITEKQERLNFLSEEVSKLRKQKSDLINMRLREELTKESFAEHFKPIEERLIQLDSQVPELEAEIDFLKIQSLSTETVLHNAKQVYEQWSEMNFEERRSIVESITNCITVGREDISFDLSHLPASSKNGVNKQLDLTHQLKSRWP